ncbi:single-stranded DNA-binding protein [Luteimonas sp. TWI1437]|uniref:single-stranded DNA-binding protein n=1 Tax=unclassified Luteimonas TaxID=2629088 RepID=UPI00320A2B4E
MKITIHSNLVDEKRWQKGDRSGVIRTQTAVAECEKFRQTIRLDLGTLPPYEAGEYTVNLEDAISVGDFGDLKLARRLPLQRVSRPATAAAKAA